MRYFAYGSNMEPREMNQAAPSARALGHGRLDGYRLEFNVYSERWEGGAANVVPDEAGHVWGIVWEVPDDEADALDTYVGHPTFYRREEVTVHLSGADATCVTYRVAHQQGYVKPTESYLHLMRSATRQQGLPPEALDALEAAAEPPYPRLG